MKKEVINVPWGKCPLDAIAEIGELTENAWIFLCVDAVRILEITSNSMSLDDYETLKCSSTSESPATTIVIERDGKVWSKVYEIDATDIAFKTEPLDPENIFFIKMG